jgi:hypothetical protein
VNRTIQLLKLSLSAILVFFAIRVCAEHWNELDGNTLNFSSFKNHPFLAILILALVPVNWLLESIKWRILAGISSSQKAYKDVLRGLSLSFITPNRIGEIVGRVAKSGDDSMQHNYAFLVGSLAQSCVTLCFGILGILMTGSALSSFGLKISWLESQPITAVLLLVLLLLICVIISRNLHRIIQRIPLPKTWKFHAEGLNKIGTKIQVIALALSTLRYLVFLTQFILALFLFGADQSTAVLAPAICLSYLVTALVPASIIGELGVRESVAVLILAPYCSAMTVIPATFLIWLLNLAIPAILGSGFWIQWKRKPDSIVAK